LFGGEADGSAVEAGDVDGVGGGHVLTSSRPDRCL
jgi:hypothetical protein